jgi:hypothetical protein
MEPKNSLPWMRRFSRYLILAALNKIEKCKFIFIYF